MPRKQTIDPQTILPLKAIAGDPDRLRNLSRAELRGHWLTHFPKEPLPPTPGLLLHELAFKAQAAFHGGLDRETEKLIKQLCRGTNKGKRDETPIKLHRSTASKLKSGTRLIRNWQGIDHEVIYQDKQYLYHDKPYRSLTQIAKVITGTHWSGPRFFGLNKLHSTN